MQLMMHYMMKVNITIDLEDNQQPKRQSTTVKIPRTARFAKKNQILRGSNRKKNISKKKKSVGTTPKSWGTQVNRRRLTRNQVKNTPKQKSYTLLLFKSR